MLHRSKNFLFQLKTVGIFLHSIISTVHPKAPTTARHEYNGSKSAEHKSVWLTIKSYFVQLNVVLPTCHQCNTRFKNIAVGNNLAMATVAVGQTRSL